VKLQNISEPVQICDYVGISVSTSPNERNFLVVDCTANHTV